MAAYLIGLAMTSQKALGWDAGGGVHSLDSMMSNRGQYKKHSAQERASVLSVYDKGEDWGAVCSVLGVNRRTAMDWIRRYESNDEGPRVGGFKPKKLNETQVDELVNWVSEHPASTLEMLRLRVKAEFEIEISRSTVSNYLDGRLITVKKLHQFSETCNSDDNKRKRVAYIKDLEFYEAAGMRLVWIDETNFNLHCSRWQGRAKRGVRATLPVANSRGSNLHIIGAMDERGLISLTTKRGSFTKVACQIWIVELLQTLAESDTRNTVVICDNAPCHNGLEEVFTRTEYRNFKLLRLGPYSPALNPIEGIWSVLKSHLKKAMRDGYECMLRGDPTKQLSQSEWRVQFLERKFEESKSSIMPDHCLHMVQHVKKRFSDVLQFRDL